MANLSLLRNPAWQGLNSVHQSLGQLTDGAAAYHEDISIFAALETPGNPAGLANIVDINRAVGILSTPEDAISHFDQWQEMTLIPVHQMISQPVPNSEPDFGRLLNEADAQHMLTLAQLTEPGPFSINTGKMGSYFGIDGPGGLLSMAGERLKLPGWSEVSGVCSHPDARGRGYAYKLIEDLLRGIANQNCGAFLHVRKGSPSEQTAIALYERLGFKQHQPMVVQIIQRTI